MAFTLERFEERGARWANIVAAIPGTYCAYVLFAQRNPGWSVPPMNWTFTLACVTFLGCICIGAILNFARRSRHESQRSVPTSPSPSRLKIHNANYSTGDGRGESFDVTECLQKMIRGDGLVLDIENGNFQVNGRNYVPKDPFFGVMKRLDVTYSFVGVTGRAIRPEGTRVVLPEDTFIASAVAAIPLIPFSKLQLEAFQLAKDMRAFLRNFEPQPPEIDARTQDEQTMQRLLVERTRWRNKIWSAYELQFTDRKRTVILEFGSRGFPLDLRVCPRGRHEPANVITWEADMVTALAHKPDGVKLTAEV